MVEKKWIENYLIYGKEIFIALNFYFSDARNKNEYNESHVVTAKKVPKVKTFIFVSVYKIILFFFILLPPFFLVSLTLKRNCKLKEQNLL